MYAVISDFYPKTEKCTHWCWWQFNKYRDLYVIFPEIVYPKQLLPMTCVLCCRWQLIHNSDFCIVGSGISWRISTSLLNCIHCYDFIDALVMTVKFKPYICKRKLSLKYRVFVLLNKKFFKTIIARICLVKWRY